MHEKVKNKHMFSGWLTKTNNRNTSAVYIYALSNGVCTTASNLGVSM